MSTLAPTTPTETLLFPWSRSGAVIVRLRPGHTIPAAALRRATAGSEQSVMHALYTTCGFGVALSFLLTFAYFLAPAPGIPQAVAVGGIGAAAAAAVGSVTVFPLYLWVVRRRFEARYADQYEDVDSPTARRDHTMKALVGAVHTEYGYTTR